MVSNSTKYHRYLAEYFAGKSLYLDVEKKKTNTRKLVEQPWQLAEIEGWEELKTLLSDLQYFDALWKQDRNVIMSYWSKIESRSPLRMTGAYSSVLEHQEILATKQLRQFSILFGLTGRDLRIKSAIEYVIIDRLRKEGDKQGLAIALGHLIIAIKWKNDPELELNLIDEQEKLCRDLNDRDTLASCLKLRGQYLFEHNNFDGALENFNEAKALCEKTGNKERLSCIFVDIATILEEQNKYDESLNMLVEAEKYLIETGNRHGLLVCYCNHGNLELKRGRPKEGIEYAKKQECICHELGIQGYLALCLSNQAAMQKSLKNYEVSLELLSRAESIWREVTDNYQLIKCLKEQAKTMILAKKNYNLALEKINEAKRICRISNLNNVLPELQEISTIISQDLKDNFDRPETKYPNNTLDGLIAVGTGVFCGSIVNPYLRDISILSEISLLALVALEIILFGGLSISVRLIRSDKTSDEISAFYIFKLLIFGGIFGTIISLIIMLFPISIQWPIAIGVIIFFVLGIVGRTLPSK